MKKYIIHIISIVLVLGSCKPHQEAIAAKELLLKGEWSLDKVSYTRDGIFEVTLFNDATAECFTGSTWSFIPNNHTGSYTVNPDVCSQTGKRNFRFTVFKSDTDGAYAFMFKHIDSKKKDIREDNQGYRMALKKLEENTMTLIQMTTVEGKPFGIVMDFNKK